MDKLWIGGVLVAGGLIGFKAGIYINTLYKLKKERRQKVVSLGTYSEYKKRLEKEKEM